MGWCGHERENRPLSRRQPFVQRHPVIKVVRDDPAADGCGNQERKERTTQALRTVHIANIKCANPRCGSRLTELTRHVHPCILDQEANDGVGVHEHSGARRCCPDVADEHFMVMRKGSPVAVQREEVAHRCVFRLNDVRFFSTRKHADAPSFAGNNDALAFALCELGAKHMSLGLKLADDAVVTRAPHAHFGRRRGEQILTVVAQVMHFLAARNFHLHRGLAARLWVPEVVPYLPPAVPHEAHEDPSVLRENDAVDVGEHLYGAVRCRLEVVKLNFAAPHARCCRRAERIEAFVACEEPRSLEAHFSIFLCDLLTRSPLPPRSPPCPRTSSNPRTIFLWDRTSCT